ncbi:MAG: GNAT family N-acetyltransferase [Magnetospirillum sp.]|nr:MAG: GNAT family N-acetyltransferase [Magnetospirillum sp.]
MAGAAAITESDGGNEAPVAVAGGVHVRLAKTEADLRAMLDLGRLLHAESRYRTLPVDEARLLAMGRRALETRNPGLILAERDGRIVGMAVVALGEHFFSPALCATVQMIYVAPEARGGASAVKLIRGLRTWAKQAGAHDLHINVTTGIKADKTDRMLRRMGFRQTGGNYVLEGVGG